MIEQASISEDPNEQVVVEQAQSDNWVSIQEKSKKDYQCFMKDDGLGSDMKVFLVPV